MITLDQARTLSGTTLLGAGGAKLGTIDTLYADREDGDPTFATVHTGMFGSRTHFVPLAEATLSDDTVTVPYDKDLVTSAPHVEPDVELEPAEEQRLYDHYGLGCGQGQRPDGAGTASAGTSTGTASTGTAWTGTADPTTSGTAAAAAAVGHDTGGPTTDSATERLRVGSGRSEAGRARLHRYVVSERESATVPVSHEEVPVERARLDAETVTSQESLTEDVRGEQIGIDGGDGPSGTSGTRTDADRTR